jgi:flagellar FliL protein
MAEDVAGVEVGEDVETKRPKGSLGKKLLLGINLLLFLAGVVFFLLTKFGVISNPLLSQVASPSAQTEQEENATTAAESPPENLVAMPLRPLVVNLSGNHGKRYLRLILELEVKGDEAKATIDARLGQIRNYLIFLLSSKTYDDVDSTQGKYQLQAEITQTLNDTLGSPLVAKTYFTEFIVQ